MTERNVAADLRAYRDWLRAQMVRADSGQPFYENALNTFYMHLGYHQRAELDAQRSVQPQAVFISNEQRAETPREPVEELTRERDYLREVVSGQAARISEIQRDAAAVRQEAIDQCIAIVAASSIHGHSVVEPVIHGAIEKLRALR